MKSTITVHIILYMLLNSTNIVFTMEPYFGLEYKIFDSSPPELMDPYFDLQYKTFISPPPEMNYSPSKKKPAPKRFSQDEFTAQLTQALNEALDTPTAINKKVLQQRSSPQFQHTSSPITPPSNLHNGPILDPTTNQKLADHLPTTKNTSFSTGEIVIGICSAILMIYKANRLLNKMQ